MTSYYEWLQYKIPSRLLYDAEAAHIEEERLREEEYERTKTEEQRRRDEEERKRLMMTQIVWLSYKKETPSRGYWDDALIEDIFSRQMWSPINANEFEHVNGFDEVPRKAEGCIVVLPARHHAHEQWSDKLNDDTARFRWVIFMFIGDEESAFPVWRIKHRNCRIWLMMPRDQQDKHKMVHVRLPNGYPTDMAKYRGQFRKEELEKPLDFFFSGQDTHYRRHIFVEYAQSIAASVGAASDPMASEGGVIVKTDGFTQGLDHDTYYRMMASSKIVPCPCGAQAPDSFRFYETLESGGIPIADNRSSNGDFPPGYWSYLFQEDLPFPVIDDWRTFPTVFLDTMKNWLHIANQTGAWWLKYKRHLTYQLESDINELSGKVPEAKSVKDKITVIISSSPIPSHPSPHMIKETIASVRGHLPDCEIFILQDGVRPEQEHMRAAYEKYKQELLFLCRNEYHNVLPIIHDEFLHQAQMTRLALDQIKTPLLLFMEHDTPLCDELIEWDGIVKAIESGYTESVRFHHHDTPFIHPEHVDLALDKDRQEVCGIKLVRTKQYSQRPHLASIQFYRNLLSHFSFDCRTFIEDAAATLFYENQNPFKLSIYTPEGDTIKRSRDLNGREGGPKFDDRLIF